ncbi:Flagellar associated protein [Plasmodiophora brassicae]|uniref:Flagellar associated protein n=1 Tax=Plasmodiophora brassicae TaxID=37360 RepID=A0A0G4IQH1_PLABS|nr:hypothetical protein PBRA_000754 [Plasmodiophora brassicae]SPQ97719.1 unnamed protein product [Plasmodiophora brassicae]
MLISMERFALRQFARDAAQQSVGVIDFDPDEFTRRVNEIVERRMQSNPDDPPLKPGYAPFCKHVFVDNFTPATAYAIPITADNRHLLRSDYVARTPKELPVLQRWFPKDAVQPPVAKYLDVILYSREQIMKENAATGEGNTIPDSSEWGIISIKAQMVDEEIPMAPITMMRNALPLREGGSGVPLDHDLYLQSVQVWRTLATVL